ncbi:MAG: hypothetical protein R3297_04500 [Desulfobulbales bacterium]|nr:hypothetical protein [Desulfobulbales bacterium]
MYGNTKVLIPAVLLLVAVFSMSGGPSSAMSITPGIYHFAGRIMNQEDKPVADCLVILSKRQAQKEDKQKQEARQSGPQQFVVISEEAVATTDNNGNYAFVFEPLSADDFWVFFKADGYRTRAVELNRLMRSRFFQKPNKSPISLHVVLEKN